VDERMGSVSESDVMKSLLRSGHAASGASEREFHAALLGVLSTRVDLATWAEAVSLAADCFRDRKRA
jgi:hypothetical protein